jgi:POT family proton-dependent oligopeptide transporter
MLAFAALMIGALYLDTRVNYLFYLLTGSFIFIIAVIFSDKNLTSDEKHRIWVMVIIAFFVIFFWGAYEQTGASLSVFADQQTNLNLWGSYHMPRVISIIQFALLSFCTHLCVDMDQNGKAPTFFSAYKMG